MPATERPLVRFGTFAIDLVSHELLNDGRRISLQEKPFQVLAILLEHPGRLVTREELRRRLWPADTFVDFEHSINTAIKKVREAVDDSGDHPRFIETLPRRGYRFIASVELPDDGQSSSEVLAAIPHHVFKPGRNDVETRSPAWLILLLACVGILVLAVVGTSLWLRYSRAASDPDPSIAVLPFADLSAAHDQEYLSDGLAEEILDHLNKIPNLKVTARTSAFQFKGKNEDTKLIGEKLRVATLLEGSVRREGDRIRITVQLIKADDGFHLWSDSYDRNLKDLFTVEDDIANAVASALQPRLLASNSRTTLPSSRGTNPTAYESFLRARHLAHLADEESMRKGIDLASAAIHSDPKYAPAYALRAYMELYAGGMAWTDLPEAAERARRDTERAISLDPSLADGYRVLADVQAWFESNCRDAEVSLKKALELAPGDPDNIGQSALLAMCLGRVQEAAELWKQELSLDPLRPEEYATLAQSLLDLGQFDEAHTALAKSSDLNPNLSMVHELQGEVYLAQGRPQDALGEMEREPQPLYRDLGEGLVYHALGRRQDSDAALNRLISQHSRDAAYQIAQVYAYRGELDEAFHWLGRAYAQHDSGFMYFKSDPKMKSLRSDPRYAQMLKLLGLAGGQGP